MDAQAIVQATIDSFRRNVMEHYFDFNGRVGRSEFWFFVLGYVVLAVVVAIVGSILRTGILSSLLDLALLLPSIGITARRLHDVGKTGWLQVLPAVPAVAAVICFVTVILYVIGMILLLAAFACGLYVLYLCVQPSVAGQNQYGAEPPKASTAASATT